MKKKRIERKTQEMRKVLTNFQFNTVITFLNIHRLIRLLQFKMNMKFYYKLCAKKKNLCSKG